jgi:hypothetical protein
MRQQMQDDPKTPPLSARTQDQAIAELICKVNEIHAARDAPDPTPEPDAPRDPWVDKPGPLIAAEKEMWRWGIIETLQLGWCKGPGACQRGRCKRAGRCAELEKLRPELERARAALADAQARWPRPAGLTQPPARRRRRRSVEDGA